MNETRTNANMNESNVVGALFRDRQAASTAVDELTYAGFENDQINTWTDENPRPDRTDVKDPDDVKDKPTLTPDASSVGDSTLSGAGTGVALGGAAGAVVGAGAASGLGAGPAVAGGAVSGAAAGAALGGLAGAFRGFGLGDDEARYFEGDYHKGEILITVNAGGRRIEAKQILERNGGRTGASTGGVA